MCTGALLYIAEAKNLYLQQGGLKPNTIRGYDRFISRLEKSYPDRTIESFKRLDFENYKNDLLNNFSKSTALDNLVAVRCLFRYCFEVLELDSIHPDKIKLIKCQRGHLGFTPNDKVEELLKFFDKTWSGQRNKLIVELLVTTGLRAEELRNLKWSDINFGNNTIYVYGKGDKPAEVYLVPKVLKLIEKFERRGEYVITTRSGGQICSSWLRTCFNNWGQNINCHLSPHTFRKTFARNLYLRSNDLLRTQQALRHNFANTTQIYVGNLDTQEFVNKYTTENIEINFSRKKGHIVQLELKGTCISSKKKSLERAIGKAINDILGS